MALLDDLFKGSNLVAGLTVAVGAAVIMPIAWPVLRPVAKAIIKIGLLAYDEGSHVLGQLNSATPVVSGTQPVIGQNSGSVDHSSTQPLGEQPELGQATTPREPRSPAQRRVTKPRPSRT
jgi:hypothetical protein